MATDPRVFLNDYCISCHGPDKQKAERRFDQLALPATTAEHVIDLQDIIDQLNLGEMPPKKSKQPTDAERSAMAAALTEVVAQARSALRSTGGQTVLRRLNKREYLNTVGDLFALDMRLFDPTTKFPRDQMAEHMDNLGDVLQTSGYLLAQYLDAADQVVERAFSVTGKPEEKTWRFTDNFRPQQEHTFPHGAVYKNRYLCLYEVPDTENHEGGYGYIHDFKQGVPVDGLYEIRVKAQAMHREHPYDPAIFQRDTAQPFRLGIVPGDVKAGPLHHPQPIEPQLAEVTLKDGEAEWHTLKVPLLAGQTPRFIFPNGMANSRRAFGTLARKYQDQWPEKERKDLGIFQARRVVLQYGKMPHIRIHEVEIRGPIVQEWPPVSQRSVLGEAGFEPERRREILQSFASRAYRRPATADEVDRLMRVVDTRRQAGSTPFEAMKDGLKAALCSPAFLYLADPAAKEEKLSAHAFATRLSYFLWSTMPDAELRALADSGELLRDEVKLEQTRRLLASPRAEAFIEGFLDAWLNLRSLGDMPPDRDAFARFYADGLKPAMKQETRLFMRHLLDQNENLYRFLDADFTFVNQPLADLYGLGRISPPEAAQEFRKVSLTDRRRGGLLGQASVLTVSANGIETSPVVRGIWLLENILGTPPPPPPDNVPPIDPDIRGAKSMREILTKHRDNTGCYECHAKIDPPGFALENYDPIGQWRTHYPAGKKQGPKIDASGEMPDGARFEDITGFKALLLKKEAQFRKTLAERLLAYACGRRMEGLDRPQVDAVLAVVEKEGNGLRTLVEKVVLSEVFARR
ncbi:MAG TPA: DUF1592 domain-containing protein [Prosthecobacter sp.]|nr:DUF1592 domain-containing protein [Prosthecobacter sp.]HRK13995.1 DUF1592 domain-containing protein [Prosthecobacter sp.]